MNKKLTILCDMDCIVVSMLGPWVKRYEKETGQVIHVSDLTDYNLHKRATHPAVLDEILNSDGFFADLPAVPKAIWGVRELLRAGHDVVFLTQAPRASDFGVRDKREWMRRNLPEFDITNMIFAHRKELVAGDVLIDDAPHHLEKWKKSNPNGKTATLNWNYNQDVEVDFRADVLGGWESFVGFIEKIST